MQYIQGTWCTSFCFYASFGTFIFFAILGTVKGILPVVWDYIFNLCYKHGTIYMVKNLMGLPTLLTIVILINHSLCLIVILINRSLCLIAFSASTDLKSSIHLLYCRFLLSESRFVSPSLLYKCVLVIQEILWLYYVKLNRMLKVDHTKPFLSLSLFFFLLSIIF